MCRLHHCQAHRWHKENRVSSSFSVRPTPQLTNRGLQDPCLHHLPPAHDQLFPLLSAPHWPSEWASTWPVSPLHLCALPAMPSPNTHTHSPLEDPVPCHSLALTDFLFLPSSCLPLPHPTGVELPEGRLAKAGMCPACLPQCQLAAPQEAARE